MNEIKELLQVDWKTVLLGVVVLAAFTKTVIDFCHWLGKQFGIELKADRIKREEHELLMKAVNRIDGLEENRKSVYEETRKTNAAFDEKLQSLSVAIEKLSSKVDDMAEKNDATERADLKDRIAQRYRKYAAEKIWTAMEKESFLGLIKDYEAHGGKNSFVHDICEPESHTWAVADD